MAFGMNLKFPWLPRLVVKDQTAVSMIAADASGKVDQIARNARLDVAAVSGTAMVRNTVNTETGAR